MASKTGVDDELFFVIGFGKFEEEYPLRGLATSSIIEAYSLKKDHRHSQLAAKARSWIAHGR